METSAAVTVTSPFPEWAWPLAWEWASPYLARVRDDFGPQTIDDFVRDAVTRERRGLQRSWCVRRDGEAGGLITFQPWNPVCGSVHATFKRAFWGSATTDASLSLVHAELFDSGLRNLVSIVFSDNHAIRSLAKRIGMHEAGTIRHYTLRGGEPVDGVLLSISQEEFLLYADACSTANHDGSVRARRGTDQPLEDLDQ